MELQIQKLIIKCTYYRSNIVTHLQIRKFSRMVNQNTLTRLAQATFMMQTQEYSSYAYSSYAYFPFVVKHKLESYLFNFLINKVKTAYVIIKPILIQVYPHKWGWPDLPQQQSL